MTIKIEEAKDNLDIHKLNVICDEYKSVNNIDITQIIMPINIKLNKFLMIFSFGLFFERKNANSIILVKLSIIIISNNSIVILLFYKFNC